MVAKLVIKLFKCAAELYIRKFKEANALAIDPIGYTAHSLQIA